MKEFTKKLQEDLKNAKSDNKDEFKIELEKRAENAEKEADKNQKLLDELEKLAEKLNDVEMFDKMDKIKQSTKNQTKNLDYQLKLI